MERISRDRIMKFYDDYIETKEDIDFVVNELNHIYDIKQLEDAIDCSKIKEFTLNSDSWQVANAKANGHYTFVGMKDDDNFIFMQEETKVLYAIDEYTLRYLVANKDYQDYMFIYAGWWGDYRTLSI